MKRALAAMVAMVCEFVKTVVITLSCLFLLWILVSWYDVVAHNMEPGGTQWEHNAFVMIVKGYEGRHQ